MSEPLRALVVEDSEEDVRLLLRELDRSGYEVIYKRVETPEAMEEALRDALRRGESWDVVIDNYCLPRFGAFEALELLRRWEFDTPFIVVSGRTGEGVATEAIKAEAHDYIVKSKLARLGPTVRRELREVEVRREQRRAGEASLRGEERHRTSIDQSTKGVWRLELERPILVDSPEDVQIEHLYRHGYLTEFNEAITQVYGFSHSEDPEEIVGARLGDLLPRSIPENLELMRAFISSGYRLTDAESRMVDPEAETKYFLDNLYGVVEDGSLVRVRGTRREVTEHKRAEEALRQNEELYRTVVEHATENIFVVDVVTKSILEFNVALCRSLGYTSEELRGMTLYDLVANDRESVDLDIGRVLAARNLAIGERKYRYRDGSLADVEVNVSLISYGGREALCVISRDVTERKHTETKLRQSLDALLAMYEAGHILGSTLESEEIGSSLLQLMQRISSSVTAVISVPDEQRQLRVWQAIGFESLWRRARYTPEVRAALQTVMETGEHTFVQLKPPDPTIESLVGLFLPLRIRNQTIGVLEVYGPRIMAEKEIVDILLNLTVKAASALENARLYEKLSERERQLKELVGKLIVTQEEERRRVAYEVHDGPTQVAVAAYQHLQAFARRYSGGSPKDQEALDTAVGLARRTVGESRRIIENLRPTALDDFGLATAIRLQVDALRDEGWQISYKETLGEQRIPDQIETALYRVAQEALRNVRKHAGTTRVRVRLGSTKHSVRVHVRDWGDGFGPVSPRGADGPGERVGLPGMQERVALVGGELKIYSKKGVGTLVMANVPISGRAAVGNGAVGLDQSLIAPILSSLKDNNE